MDISIEKLKQLNSLEIYNMFKNDFDNFYDGFKNIIISSEEYKNMILEEIEESKDKYESNNNFASFILKKVEERLRIEQEVSNNSNYHFLISEAKEYEVLPQEVINELITKAQSGDKEAKEKIVKHNLKLVINIAKKFMGYGVELDDLIQEGIFGLYEAIDRFDISKGFRFSTYANYWIRNSVFKVIRESGRNIKIPPHQFETLIRYRRTFNELFNELHRDPTLDEMAERLGITYEKCLKLYNMQVDTLSINKKISSDEEEETELGDFIESDDDVENIIEKDSLQEEVKDVLNNSKLTEREKYIIIYRFGLFEKEKETLEQIGEELGLTRERVRQLEKNALEKIKATYKGKGLLFYIHDDVKQPNLKIPIEEYEEIRKKITKEEFDYFFECGFTPIEMMVTALSMGLIDDRERNYRQMSIELNKSISSVYSIQKSAFKKLKSIPSKNYKQNVIFEIAKRKIDKSQELCRILRCTLEELEVVKNHLFSNEVELLNKRNSDYYKRIMTKEELDYYNGELLLKIRNIIKEHRKDKSNSEEILSVINALGIKITDNNKNFFNTSVYNELKKYFSIKEIITVMLLFGYVDDSYFSSDYIAKLLKLPLKEVEMIYQKANELFNNNQVLLEDKNKRKVKGLKKY